MKGSGKPDDRKGHVRFDVAGAGNGFTVELVRHRQTKETEQIGFTYGTPRQSSTLHLFGEGCEGTKAESRIKDIGRRLYCDLSIIRQLYSAYAADRDPNKEILPAKQLANSAIRKLDTKCTRFSSS